MNWVAKKMESVASLDGDGLTLNWGTWTGKEVPVRFCHYWSGREFSENPLPSFLVRLFSQRKYGTQARVTVDDGCELVSYTVCSPGDMPQRSEGRWWALLKLETSLHRLGWYLEREDGASMAQVEASRHDAKVAKEVARKNAMIAARAEGMKRQPAIRAERARKRQSLQPQRQERATS